MVWHDIRRLFDKYVGEQVEIKMKKGPLFVGKLIWVSPDKSMAELQLESGEIKTFSDIDVNDVILLST
ncbi:MAG TPA: hypothetical protein VJ824_03820 [Bacillota bacterium]|nr:hypothetical protein [Bacillota bacterium]